jgi:hypothetical protein
MLVIKYVLDTTVSFTICKLHNYCAQAGKLQEALAAFNAGVVAAEKGPELGICLANRSEAYILYTMKKPL